MFLIIKVLFTGMIQPVLPLFWWLCLCYEAYISSSSASIPFESRSISKGFSFCRTRCIYSEFQLNGSFKYLDSLSQHPGSQDLMSRTASLYLHMCPSVHDSSLLLMRYVPQGGLVSHVGMFLFISLCFIPHLLYVVVRVY